MRHWSLPLCLLVALSAVAQDGPSASTAAEDPPHNLGAPFASPRQLLRLWDIGESDFRSFRDGQPIGPDDQEALTKILYRMPQIGPEEIDRWQRGAVSWDSVRADPDSARGEFFTVSGRVRKLTSQSLTPRLAALFDFNDYYQVELELDNAQGTAVIFTRTIPQAWRDRPQLNERSRAVGLLVKMGEERGGQPALMLVAPRVAWLPDRLEPDLGVGADQVLLSQLGMDAGLWDDARTRQRLPIGADERECFYALLSAVGRATPQALARLAKPVSLATLLLHPEQEQGRIWEVTGRVRRITRVVVDEPDIRKRFAMDAYYQLDVMVHVGDRPIEVRGVPGEQAGPVYRESFPFTCCTQELPADWEPLVGRANINRPVLMHGVFYKLWVYSNALVTSHDARQRQLSPMFVVGVPQAWNMSSGSAVGPGLWVVLGFCGLLVAVWGTVWAMNRSDRRRKRTISPPPLDLD